MTTKCATTEQKVPMRSYDPTGANIALEYDGSDLEHPMRKNIGGHVTGVTRNGNGDYTVTFDRAVTNCIATPTLPQNPNDIYGVTENTTNDHEKAVATFILGTATPIDALFDLVMTC